MEENVKKSVEEYQCSGCTNGGDISCFEKSIGGIGCDKHSAGTIISGIGKIFLGMPKGFNRLGKFDDMIPFIWDKFEDSWKYSKFNMPVWKYLNENGHTIVRGLIPRRNEPFLHIYLENCMDKIDCLEITQEDIDKMD